MILRCLDEYQTEHEGRLWKFEETSSSGEVYEVDDDLGEELLATGRFQPTEDVEGLRVVKVEADD